VTFLRRLTRRRFVHESAAAAGALMLPPGIASAAGARAARTPRLTDGPYGPLGPADPATGVQVPEGFTIREVGHAGVNVGLTTYTWPSFPDGSGSFAQPDGSWIFVANSEIPAGLGGVSAIHFSKDGDILDAYRIAGDTNTNCGGGTTPWGTWLTGEEVDRGRVLECDPKGEQAPVPRPALGLFSHEYIQAHEAQKKLYLTEDESGGGFYRFTPAKWGDLSAGVLEIATLQPNGRIAWSRIPDPLATEVPTRNQVKGVSNMKRPEGLCIDDRTGVVFFAESSAGRIIAYDPVSGRYELIYGEDDFEDPILTDTDNVAVSPLTGDLFICEDAGSFDICILTPEGEMAKFVHLAGPQHGDPSTDASSETTGPSFDPSGTRFYFSSQRAGVTGVTYEVTGPWRARPQATIKPRPQKVRMTVKRRIGRKRLKRGGLPVEIAIDTRSSVALELRARTAKGRRVVVGRAAAKDLMPGRAKLVVPVPRRVPGERMTLVATLTEDVGRRAVARRRVELG
jgi:hypothetical protein